MATSLSFKVMTAPDFRGPYFRIQNLILSYRSPALDLTVPKKKLRVKRSIYSEVQTCEKLLRSLRTMPMSPVVGVMSPKRVRYEGVYDVTITVVGVSRSIARCGYQC